MSRRTIVSLATAWILSLVGVGLWAQSRDQTAPRPVPSIEYGESYGPIIGGENIGFQRVAGPRDPAGKITGRILIRVDGEWLELQSPMRVMR